MKSLQKQQLVQNAVAWTVFGISHYVYICLCKLHELSIDFQVRFKALVVIYKALQDIGPGYSGTNLFLLPHKI